MAARNANNRNGNPPPLVGRVGARGLLVPAELLKAALGRDGLRKLFNALTVVERPCPGRPKNIARKRMCAHQCERIDGVTFYRFPRVKAALFLHRALLAAVEPAADAFPPPRSLPEAAVELTAPLFEYQQAILDFLFGAQGPFGARSVAAHCATAYLQMDTGLGKTRVGCAVVARCRVPTAVVVPTEAIREQWLDEFAEVLPDLVCGAYQNPAKGSRKVPAGPATHDVVVCIINTFSQKEASFLAGYGLVILDEAHEYCGPEFSKALWLAQTRFVLGLSATPNDGPNGLDRYVNQHLGPVIWPKRDVPGYDVRHVVYTGQVRVIEYAGHPEHSVNGLTPSGTISSIMTINNVVEDPHRLCLVAAEVERLFRLHETETADALLALGLGPRPEAAATDALPAGEVRRHGVFVFAELREYLPALRAKLLERFESNEILVPELDPGHAEPDSRSISVLRGASRPVARAELGKARRAGSHIVLTTYGYSRRGISLPDMTAIVLATPRRNGYRQILGRITRRGSDASIVRQIVDIVDTRVSLKTQFGERKKIYVEKGFELSHFTSQWDDFPLPGDEPVPPDPAPAAPPANGAHEKTKTLREEIEDVQRELDRLFVASARPALATTGGQSPEKESGSGVEVGASVEVGGGGRDPKRDEDGAADAHEKNQSVADWGDYLSSLLDS